MCLQADKMRRCSDGSVDNDDDDNDKGTTNFAAVVIKAVNDGASPSPPD